MSKAILFHFYHWSTFACSLDCLSMQTASYFSFLGQIWRRKSPSQNVFIMLLLGFRENCLIRQTYNRSLGISDVLFIVIEALDYLIRI